MTSSLMVDSISDQLYRILVDRITSGAVDPGQRLDPQAVAAEFGVSRTPVRDALLRLERDRLIVTRPRAGTFVGTPGIEDVHDVCQLRKGLEWVATGIAALQMPIAKVDELRRESESALVAAEAGDFEPFFASDSNIHLGITEATGRSRLIETRASVEPFVRWLRVLGATGPHRVAGSTQRHLEILDGIAARDVEAAQRAAAIHLDEVNAWTVADMESAAIVLPVT